MRGSSFASYFLVITNLFIEMAEQDLNISDRLDALDRKFIDMMENMNINMEKLSREVASVQMTSAQRGFMEPQHSRKIPTEHRPPRTPHGDFEAENNVDEFDGFADDDDGDEYRSRDKRNERRHDRRDRRYNDRREQRREDR